MTEEEANFIEAARHAGFRIVRRDNTWKLQAIGESCFIAIEVDLFALGHVIKRTLSVRGCV